MHLAFSPSRQVIEVAHIFSAHRPHHSHKPLMRKMFSRASTPTLLPTAKVSIPFRANLPCLISRLLVQRLLLWSSHLYLNQGLAKENHRLLTRGQ
jgi:hypothetical protein